MILLVAPLLLAAVQPLPDPRDARAGQLASACVYYYRLQSTDAPGGSRACEAEGYGLDFMRAHWKEIAGLEARHQAELEAHLQRGREVAALLPHTQELEPQCFFMVLDGGPAPDGGARVCELLGFTHDMVTRTARHRAYLAEQADAERRRKLGRSAVIGAAAGALVAFAAWMWRRRA